MQHSKQSTKFFLLVALGGVAFGQNKPVANSGPQVFESMKRNAEALKQYTHQMRRTVIVNGQQKSVSLSLVRYVNGERQVMNPPPPQRGGRGLRGAIVVHKKEEMRDYVERLGGLVHRYLSPAPELLRTLPEKMSMSVDAVGLRKISIHGFVQSADSMALVVDSTAKPVSMELDTTLDGGPVHIQLNYSTLPDGVAYPAETTFRLPKKKLELRIATFDYQRSGVSGPPADPH
jgi:hypothetical protein